MGEVAELTDSRCVQLLDEGEEELDGVVVIAAVHDAVVGVGVADGDGEGDGGDTAIGFLDFGGIVAVADDNFLLERDGFFGSGLAGERSKLLTGHFGGIVEKEAGATAEGFLGEVGARAGNVAGDATFENNGDFRLDDFRRGTSAGEQRFFLNGNGIEELIGMRGVGEAVHHVDDDGATDAVVEGLAHVVLRAIENDEGGVGNDGVADRDAEGLDFVGVTSAEVEEEIIVVVEELALFVSGGEVSVADDGRGVDGPFGAEDDPTLAHESFIEEVAEGLDGEETIGCDAADEPAEFVHVGVDHDAGAVRALRGDDGTEAVVGDVVGEGRHVLDHDFTDGLFVAGGAGSFGKFFEELRSGILGAGGKDRGEGRECKQAERHDGATRERHDGSEK